MHEQVEDVEAWLWMIVMEDRWSEIISPDKGAKLYSSERSPVVTDLIPVDIALSARLVLQSYDPLDPEDDLSSHYTLKQQRFIEQLQLVAEVNALMPLSDSRLDHVVPVSTVKWYIGRFVRAFFKAYADYLGPRASQIYPLATGKDPLDNLPYEQLVQYDGGEKHQQQCADPLVGSLVNLSSSPGPPPLLDTSVVYGAS
jgi:hypothetical protein